MPKGDRHFTFKKEAEKSGRSQLILKAKTEKALKAKKAADAALADEVAN